MDILFVVPYVPNLIRFRSYNLIRQLAARGHRVTVWTLWTDEHDRKQANELESSCHRVEATYLPRWRSLWNCLLALPGPTPLQAVYCWQPQVRSKISNLRSQFDVIHVEHLRGARYGLEIRSQVSNFKSQTPVVWDSVDCITYLFEQACKQSQSAFGKLVTRFELVRTRRYEGWLAWQFDHVLITSETDQAELERISHRVPARSRPPISVLPNGVDLEYFTPSDEARKPDTLIFSGKMSYHANITAALHLINDILPLVWAQRPNVQAWIVGKDPPKSVCALASRNPRVVVTGTVPDMRSYLRRASIAVVPLVYGAGSQFKVMEAAACGTPVVASRRAVLSLQAVDGEHLLVADDAATFARHILRLLADQDLQRRLGAAGRHYVEAHHDWSRIAAQLESIYQLSLGNVKRDTA